MRVRGRMADVGMKAAKEQAARANIPDSFNDISSSSISKKTMRVLNSCAGFIAEGRQENSRST